MKVRRVALALACAAVGTLAGPAYADDDDGEAALAPLPPVDLASSDLTTSGATPSMNDDDDDDDDGITGDLENVVDPSSRKPRLRHRRPPGPHARLRHHLHRRPLLRGPSMAPPRTPRSFPPQRPIARRQHTIFFRERFVDHGPTQERESVDEGRARGGLLVTGGATSYSGLAPREGIMAGARLQVATPLPTLPGRSSSARWLSRAAVGLTAGFDAGSRDGVDTQVWHTGLALSMGAPWTRDFIGLGLEGGLLGGHYFDGTDVTLDPKPYGLGRLTFQIPLQNALRPFLAGELGVTDRTTGDGLAGIAGIHAGAVWNAW